MVVRQRLAVGLSRWRSRGRYQLRLEKNLPADSVWVAAYADDVFAFVASERMRAEGGYEVDASSCTTTSLGDGNRAPRVIETPRQRNFGR